MKRLMRLRFGSEEFDPERGTSVPSFMMIFLIVLMVLELAIIGGRVAGAHGAVANAARAAARQGTLVQSKTQVGGVARSVAESNLQQADQECTPITVEPTVDDFGAGGSVEVKVTCVVKLSDLSGFGIAIGDIEISATHKEIVETYRAVEAIGP